MKRILTSYDVNQQSMAYRGTGGVSAENSAYGYSPAFFDRDNGQIYLSRDVVGKVVPFHQFDGLPEECIVERDLQGKPCAVKGTLVVGFVKDGHFFTREQVVQVIQWELDKIAS